ncbi:MAG: nucleotidyltransferase domain-containing protein [Bacteroidales bacterium]|nr:nucleotidyltransferase domain-containing protein [Bacteroidales bacterium]
MSDKLNMAIQQFFSTQPVLKAYLFGSYSRKKERKNSDIDILIELEDGVDLFQFVNIKLELEKLLNKSVDLVSANGVSPRLKPYIDKDKVLIYEK